MDAKKDEDFERIQSELGQFGLFQFLNLTLILIPIVFSAVYNAQYIFAAESVTARCTVPECETPPYTFGAGPWAAWALPPQPTCQRYRPLGATCEPTAFHTNETVACDAWVYENTHSIVVDFDLPCAEWKRTLVGTVHSTGLFFALVYTAYISDTYGRRTALLLTAVAPGVVGLAKSFSPNYYIYLVLEFLESVLGSGVYSTGFILAMELIGRKWRVLGGNALSSFFGLGQVLLALVAWAFPNWKTLLRILYAPSLLFILYYFCIHESIRWLLAKGRKEDAAKIIYQAAKINKKKLSPETIKYLQVAEEVPSNVEVTSTTPKIRLFTEVVRSRILMIRMCVCSFWWVTVTFTYYGLSINSVSLAGNKYINYILTSLIEIPGYFLSVITLDRFGRKRSIMVAFFICGLSLLVLPFIPDEYNWIATSLTLLGKLCISMTFSSIYIYTSELFPTNARHSLLGACSMVGRIGSITAPLTPLLMVHMSWLPYILFGGMAFTAGLLMTLTPETLHHAMPDTVAQAERMSNTAVQSDEQNKTVYIQQ